METSCVIVRLKPGSVERAREWAKQMNDRPDEVLETLRAEGVAVESVFLDSDDRGDLLVYYVKAESLEIARQVSQRSTHPIDGFHEQFKVDTWDSRRPLELLIDFENLG